MTEPWIQTRSGRAVDMLAPRPEQICIADIAYALAGLCRFTGHARYTVAEHCVRVSARVADLGGSRQEKLGALLHDAAEAYIGDVSAPLKRALELHGAAAALQTIERPFSAAIAAMAGIDPALLHAPLVKRADLEMLATEARDHLSAPPRPWDLPWRPLADKLSAPWSALGAEDAFMGRYNELLKEAR